MAVALLLVVPCLATSAQSPVRSDVRTDDGHSLVVWSKRPPTPPRGEIILLHGRTWSALPNFDLQARGRNVSLMDAFVLAGYTVHAVDQRGYGASRRDASGWLTPDRASRDAENVVDWVIASAPGRRTPALLGYSRGSMTALLMAQRRPQKVSALVLYGYAWDVTLSVEPVKDAGRPPRERTTAEGAAEDFISPDSTPRGVKEAYVREALRHDPVRVDWRREHQWGEINPARVHTPVLVINGERDPVAEAGNIPALLSQLKGIDREWIVLSHADHVAHLGRQAAFVHAVGQFLDRTWRRPAETR